jgi:anti-sigma-K factor RskA
LTASLQDAEKTSTQLSAQASRLPQVERQYRDLSHRVQDQEATIQRQQMLLATDRDIRDLMNARNLHIIDVNDVDSSGKPRPTFGRVFYTEGKSLVFYAFDMGQLSKPARPAAFQAWGQRLTRKTTPASLGVFYEDTKSQNRWILKFDDPAILAEIDSVYVTVEPSGGSKAPHGAQVLFAYLGTPPNHP